MNQRKNSSLNGMFSVLQAGIFCVVAVHTGFFYLMLYQRGYTEEMVGRIATIVSVTSLITPAVLGYLCDRFRLNRILFLLSAFAGPWAYAMMQHVENFWAVAFFAVVFTAFCLGVQSIPSGWTAALNGSGCQIDYAYTRSFGSLSFALVSVLLGFVIQYFTMASLPFMLALFCTVVGICACMIPLPPRQKMDKGEESGLWLTLSNLLTNRVYVFLLVGCFLLSIPGGAFFTYFSVYFAQLGGSEAGLGVAMFVLAVVEVPVMLLYSRLESKFGVKTLVAVAIFGYGLKNLCLSMASTALTATACLTLQVFGLALVIPASQRLIAKYTPIECSATAQSFYFSVEALGFIAANILCTWLVSFVSLRGVFAITSVFAFVGTLIFLYGIRCTNE